MNYQKCTAITKDKNIVVKENKSSFCLINEGNISIEKISVDGCLIGGEQEKCDWLFVLPHINRALYVELKGSDISKGARQIEATIKATSVKIGDANKECYIATTRVPKFGSQVQKLKIDFKNKYNAVLHVKNGRLTAIV